MSFMQTEFMESKLSEGLTGARVQIAGGSLSTIESHPAETLIIILEGACCIRMAGRAVTLNRDQLLRIPASECYSVEAFADTIALRITTATPGDPRHRAQLHDESDQYLWGV